MPREIGRFESMNVGEEPARSLVAEMRVEIASLYDGLDFDGPDMPKAGSAELGPPGGDFLVGIAESGAALCCGGIKALSDTACEIKRLYVRQDVRRRGVAGELLAALEERARQLGYQVARLDTGPRQPIAQRMFEAAGYRPIANFSANPVATFFGEKTL
jgi:GNAT superfamily N-acetyltransferase